MSAPAFTITPSLYQNLNCGAAFTSNSGTTIRAVVDGTILAPASSTATSPALYGGCSIIDLNATSTDSVARDLLLYEGRVLTTQGSGTTGTLSTATNGISRTTGSWITEGWKVGHGVILIGPDTAAEDAQAGIFAVVTGVNATTLSLSGTPLTVNAALAAGTRVVRARPIGRASLKAQQGMTTTDPTPLDIISYMANGRTMRQEWKVGFNDMLLAGPASAVTAGTQLSIGGSLALF